jgi:hypothetical protein
MTMQKRPRASTAFSVGKGHGGNSNLPAIKPEALPLPIEAARLRGMIEADTKGYRMGLCSILISHSKYGWHFSIAHPKRYPTWDEVAKVRYELIPDNVNMAMILPPRSEYVNIHNYCFQCHQVRTDGDVIEIGARDV